MKIARSIKISRKQLLAHKLRTVLALVGIIIGVSAVIVMVAIGNGAQNEVLSKIEAMGTNLIVVNAGQVQKSVGRMQIRGVVTTLQLENAEALQRSLPLIEYAAPVQSKKMQVKFGNLSSNTTIVGTSIDFPNVRNFHPAEGYFFTEEENRASRRVAVLGQTVVKNLFDTAKPIGETIRIGRIPFQVIGVMESKGVDLNGVDQDDQVFIPIKTALRRVFNQNYINSIQIQVVSQDKMVLAQQQIRKLLRELHRLSRRDKEDDFTIQNQTDLLETQRETTDTFTTLIASIAGISLLVGGIGILAIMLIAIRERTNEIGLRLAVGASRRDISLQFVIESAIMSVGGGIIGIFIGIIASLIIAFGTEWATSISLSSILYSSGFSLLIGLFFGVYPAQKAARLDPIVALRSE
ncbi:ABC transporter permease [candidate division KSB1 bacterium]|nr:ABC transporter permease [candidate division KSB1 bacterium]